MKRRILLQPAADQDLSDQADYLASHHSVDTGLRFLRAAEETFQLLAGHPEIGTQAACRNSFLIGVRMFPMKRFPNHLVFYRSGKKDLDVIRVLHSARDIETLFQPSTEDGEGSPGATQKGKAN